MNYDIYVLPSFAVEVVGVGEMSDSGWEFGRSVALLICRGCLWFLMWVRLLLLL